MVGTAMGYSIDCVARRLAGIAYNFSRGFGVSGSEAVCQPAQIVGFTVCSCQGKAACCVVFLLCRP